MKQIFKDFLDFVKTKNYVFGLKQNIVKMCIMPNTFLRPPHLTLKVLPKCVCAMPHKFLKPPRIHYKRLSKIVCGCVYILKTS